LRFDGEIRSFPSGLRSGIATEEGEERLLALDLAGVDVRLDHDDRLSLRARFLRREAATVARDRDGDVLSLARASERGDAHEVGAASELAQELEDVGVEGRLRVAGALGVREEVGLHAAKSTGSRGGGHGGPAGAAPVESKRRVLVRAVARTRTQRERERVSRVKACCRPSREA
jgi:hypothetical protein